MLARPAAEWSPGNPSVRAAVLRADACPGARAGLAETPATTPLNASSPDQEKPAYRFFDPFWLPRTERAKAFVASIVERLEAREQALKLRKRRRKEADQTAWEEGVMALMSDLVRLVLLDPGKALSVSLRHGERGMTRYQSNIRGKPIKRLVKSIADDGLGLVLMEKGSREWKQMWTATAGLIHIPDDTPTLIHPASSFIEEVKALELEPDDFKRSEKEEIIILRARKKRKDRGGELIDYQETAWTMDAREKLRAVNRWLSEANIEDDGWGDVDTSLRASYRIFNNGSFEEGGRLYGTFWTSLKKTRRQYLRIDGEPVAELDYGQMGLRLLYAQAGVQPEGDDLYYIPCLGYAREGVKGLINAAISNDKPQVRMPKGVRDGFEKFITYGQAWKTIEARHHPIKHLFFKGLGLKLQVQEADIMVALLLALRDQGITALPIHDCVLVPVSRRDEAKSLMLCTFKEMTGIEGLVEVTLPRHQGGRGLQGDE
jgi:hypothetical protein